MDRRNWIKTTTLAFPVLALPTVGWSSLNELNFSELKAADFGGDFLWGAACASYQVEGSWNTDGKGCLLYTSPSPRDVEESRMPSSA